MLIALYLILIIVALSFIKTFITKWNVLIKEYRTTETPKTTLFYFAIFHYTYWFRLFVNVGVHKAGLHLSFPPIISLYRPAILIPWDELIILETPKTFPFSDKWYSMSTTKCNSIKYHIHEDTILEIKASKKAL